MTSATILVIANAIGLLFLDGFLELILMNLFIAWVEKRILRHKGFETRYGMVFLANFMSVFIGYNVIPYGTRFHLGFPNTFSSYDVLHDISMPGFIFKALSAIAITLVVEYPFFRWALKDKSKKDRLLRPFVFTNLITSLGIILMTSLMVLAFSRMPMPEVYQ